MEKTDPRWVKLQQFANDHKLVLEDHGNVGFGRPCVGFIRGGYVDHNPYHYVPNGTGNPDMEPVKDLQDDRLRAPRESVPDAYHKHDCLAVLVRDENYDEGLDQLHSWVLHLESLGPVEIVEYETGAQGIQAMMSGVLGYAIRIKPAPLPTAGEVVADLRLQAVIARAVGANGDAASMERAADFVERVAGLLGRAREVALHSTHADAAALHDAIGPMVGT